MATQTNVKYMLLLLFPEDTLDLEFSFSIILNTSYVPGSRFYLAGH